MPYRVSLLLALLLAGACTRTHVEFGECKNDQAARSSLDDTGGEEVGATVRAEVTGRHVVVLLEDLLANCCPSPAAEVEVTGSDIRVDFEDVTGTACRCMCVMDFRVEIGELDPGTYQIQVHHDGALVGEVEVTVP